MMCNRSTDGRGRSFAIKQAKKSHGSQIRRTGQPVLEQHIYPITISVIEHEIAAKRKVAPPIVAGALLHDVMDDDRNMPHELFRNKFGEEVYNIVYPLTDRFTHSTPSFWNWAVRHVGPYADKKYAVAEFMMKKLFEHMPTRHMEMSAYFRALAKSSHETRVIRLADRYNNLCCTNESASMIDGKFTEWFMFTVRETERFYLPFAKRFSPYFHELLSNRIREVTEYFRTQ